MEKVVSLPEHFANKRLNEIPVVVLDTETTGFYFGLGDRVIEVGAVRYENWQPVGTFSQLVNPQRRISEGAEKVVGLSDADLQDKPLFADIADDLLAFVDGALMVAHNAPFDSRFVGMELWLAGKHDPTPNMPALPNVWLDTYLLAKHHFYFGKNSLVNIARKLNIRIGRSHRALNDVYVTAAVLKRLTRELERRQIRSVGDLLHAQGGEIYAPPPPRFVLPEPLCTAVANQQEVEILYVENGQEMVVGEAMYAAEQKGVPHLILRVNGRVRALKMDMIFGASLT